ncbi:MAG: hypothetical protein KKA43_02465, partial [Nanoarchaeota archaeon]|nr:hypothetical protein [Nanoarchaeota archaeon]
MSENKIINWLCIFLLAASLILTSCDMVPTSDEVNYYEGTKGLEIDFLEGSPPYELYEESSFSVSFILENRGAYNILEDRQAILSINIDPFYFDVSELRNIDGLTVDDNRVILRGLQLPGKSKYYPSGYEIITTFTNLKAKLIKGQREQPSTQIFASLCYPYVTTFSEMVCVDLSNYGENLRTQACYQQDLASSGQGAPVVVTRVEVDNQPAGPDSVRPVFTIHVSNKGRGSVLSPAYNPADFDRVCSFQNLYREDFNTIDVRAALSDGKELFCAPNPMRLFNGEGFVRCQVHDEDLVIGHHNYLSSLTVNLSYVYLTSVSDEIKIKRLNVYGDLSNTVTDCSLPFQVRIGGECKTKCDYCSQSNGGGNCQPPNSKYPINFAAGGFACQCSKNDCDKLFPNGLCVPNSDYCPGGSYCCQIKCRSSEFRLEDGICHTKAQKCVASAKDTACGNENDGYVLMPKDSFCCTT